MRFPTGLIPLFMAFAAMAAPTPAAAGGTLVWGLGKNSANQFYITGQRYAFVFGLNYNGGVIVGSWTDAASIERAYLLRPGSGAVNLGLLSCCTSAAARGVTPDGQFVVGDADEYLDGPQHAFYWSSGGGLVELPPLVPGANAKAAAITDDGRYAVGSSTIAPGSSRFTAVRWIAQDTAVDLDPINSVTGLRRFSNSEALAISGDGQTIVGDMTTVAGFIRAFRWTEATPVMTDLGTLPGDLHSAATGVSKNGSVIVGYSWNGATVHGFRWSEGSMIDLSSLGGTRTVPNEVSSDGRVIVGNATASDGVQHPFRWEAGVMQKVTDWLANYGVTATLPNCSATAVNSDGSVIVGNFFNGRSSYLARVTSTPAPPPPAPAVGMALTAPRPPSGGGSSDGGSGGTSSGSGGTSGGSGDMLGGSGGTSGGSGGSTSGSNGSTGSGGGATAPATPSVPYTSGLMFLDNFAGSLSYVPGADMAIHLGEMTLNGGHGKPMRSVLEEGRSSFSAAGDLGWLNTGAGDGMQGLGEIGYGIGAADGVTLRLAAGGLGQRSTPDTGGDAHIRMAYLLPEATINPVSNLYLTGSAYYARGRLDSHRGYQNGDRLDHSDGSADLSAWGWRIRADLKDGVSLAKTTLTPFASYSALGSHRDGFTETGGSFPVRWDDQSDATHVLRAGLDATHPLTPTILLLGHLEASYGFDDATRPASGEIIDLSGFSTAGLNRHRFGAQAGLGLERTAGAGTASLMVNAATGGHNPALWLAASYKVAF